MAKAHGRWFEFSCEDGMEAFNVPEDVNTDLIDWDAKYQEEKCRLECILPFDCADSPFEMC